MSNIESNFLIFAVTAYFVSMVSYFLLASFKKENFGKSASLILILGVVLQSVSIVARISASGRLPFANLYESMISFVWGIALIYLVLERMYGIKMIGVIVAPIIAFSALYASTLNKAIEPLMPALQSNWLLAHVGVAILAYGAFAVSAGCAILYLLKDYFNISWIPSKEKMDELTYRLIALAFPFMTLVIITGAVWAEEAWGRYWSFDPKETWSLITWLVYAGYLHARLVLKWKGRVAAWLAVIGFLAVLFTYLGVSFLLSGLHSYAQ